MALWLHLIPARSYTVYYYRQGKYYCSPARHKKLGFKMVSRRRALSQRLAGKNFTAAPRV